MKGDLIISPALPGDNINAYPDIKYNALLVKGTVLVIALRNACHLIVLKNMSTSQRLAPTTRHVLSIDMMLENVFSTSEKTKKITYIEMRMIIMGIVFENCNFEQF